MADLHANVSAPRVTIVIAVRNRLATLQRCIDALARLVTLPVRLVIADTGSTDGTAEYAGALARTNPRNVIAAPHAGSALAAMNAALTHAGGHVLFLAPDVQLLRPGSLETLVEALDSDQQIGAVGPTSDLGPGPQSVEQNLVYPPLHPVNTLLGGCLLVRREAVEAIGGFDTETFSEDSPWAFADLCIRLRERGLALICCRQVMVHQEGDERELADLADAESEHRRRLVVRHGAAAVEALFQPVAVTGARVLVAVLAYSSVHPEAYANHLIELSREARDGRQTGLQIEFSVIKRSGVAEARNRVARDALAGGFTHVFYLDDDMLVPPGAIRALAAHGLPVVSGLCFLRSPPHHPSMFIDPGVPEGSVVFLRSWPEGDCIEVDAVGCACLLVHVDMFRTLSEQDPSRPYFAFDAARDGEGRVGEDIYFSKRVREAGFRIFVDTARGFGHLGPPVVVDADTVARMDRAGIGGIDYVNVAQAREDAEAVFARSPEAGP